MWISAKITPESIKIFDVITSNCTLVLACAIFHYYILVYLKHGIYLYKQSRNTFRSEFFMHLLDITEHGIFLLQFTYQIILKE